jgi:hypothetical protein
MKNKARLSKLLIAIVVAAFLVGFVTFAGLFFVSSNSRNNQDPAKQKEMMTFVLEWGRLAPFPANAINVLIETEGSSFTRSFHVSFVAPKQDIQTWIKESPGIKEATPEELSDNKIMYRITPGDGANKAELTIDYTFNKVDIYVSWS